MLEYEKITEMTEEEISELSYEKMEHFLNFKDVIENYFESVNQVQAAKNNASYHLMEKNSFSKMAKQHIPIKTYFKSVGWVLLLGIISIYYILMSQEIQTTQSYTKIYLCSLYVLFIILIAVLPFSVFFNTKKRLD